MIGLGRAEAARAVAEVAEAATPWALTGYKVYRSATPDVATTEENLFTTLPPNQTAVDAGLAPGGSFFVITGVYGNQESGPSNEASAGTPGADIGRVQIKGAKVVAKGTGFTSEVRVFVDGLPFASAAKVKAGTKVTQKGRLLTGETVDEYFTPGRRVEVTFLNDDASLTRVIVSR